MAPVRPQGRNDIYKVHLKKAIMDNLFSRMDELYGQDTLKLALDNNQLMGYSHRSYVFNGEFYNHEVDDGPPIRQKLHPSLVPRAKQLDQEFGHPLTVEKVKVGGYLSSVLAYSPYPGDYLALLPPSLHGIVKTTILTIDWAPHLSPEKIAMFMAKHGSHYELIRQRLALNLIL